MSPSESLILIANPLQQGPVFSVRDSCIHQGEYLESPSIYIPWNAWREIHFFARFGSLFPKYVEKVFFFLDWIYVHWYCSVIAISNCTYLMVNFRNSWDKHHCGKRNLLHKLCHPFWWNTILVMKLTTCADNWEQFHLVLTFVVGF